MQITQRDFRDRSDFTLIKNLLLKTDRQDLFVMAEEALQSPLVQNATHLWEVSGDLVAFALVDTYANLCFAIAPSYRTTAMQDAIIKYAKGAMRARNAALGQQYTLDASCESTDAPARALFVRSGFTQQHIRSLDYTRSLLAPIPPCVLPVGFRIRAVIGEQEVDALVALHRAAFGTNHMNAAERLAIMRTSQYVPDLDLVVETSDHHLAAFCIGELGQLADGTLIGYPDPIGTHPAFQHHGLASALFSTALQAFHDRGALEARSGTSSENIAMRCLFEKMGFSCSSEKIWFSLEV